MKRDDLKTERDFEREIYDEVDRPVEERERKDTETDRRYGNVAMHTVDPEAPRDRNETVYGETEIDPAKHDRKRDHHATDDEHL